MSETRYRQLRIGEYSIEDRATGERLGTVKRDFSVRSFRLWDAYDGKGKWIRGAGSRGEATQLVVAQYEGSAA